MTDQASIGSNRISFVETQKVALADAIKKDPSGLKQLGELLGRAFDPNKPNDIENAVESIYSFPWGPGRTYLQAYEELCAERAAALSLGESLLQSGRQVVIKFLPKPANPWKWVATAVVTVAVTIIGVGAWVLNSKEDTAPVETSPAPSAEVAVEAPDGGASSTPTPQTTAQAPSSSTDAGVAAEEDPAVTIAETPHKIKAAFLKRLPTLANGGCESVKVKKGKRGKTILVEGNSNCKLTYGTPINPKNITVELAALQGGGVLAKIHILRPIDKFDNNLGNEVIVIYPGEYDTVERKGNKDSYLIAWKPHPTLNPFEKCKDTLGNALVDFKEGRKDYIITGCAGSIFAVNGSAAEMRTLLERDNRARAAEDARKRQGTSLSTLGLP